VARGVGAFYDKAVQLIIEGYQMMEGSSAKARPFLATLAVRRTGTPSELPGRYVPGQDVWVIENQNGSIPIVTSCQAHSVAPVTKIKGERDEYWVSSISELSTKTSAQLERDDVTPRDVMLLPELLTETDDVGERDDVSPRLLLELATRTAAVPERDDR
jgi:hypothetical protein